MTRCISMTLICLFDIILVIKNTTRIDLLQKFMVQDNVNSKRNDYFPQMKTLKVILKVI